MRSTQWHSVLPATVFALIVSSCAHVTSRPGSEAPRPPPEAPQTARVVTAAEDPENGPCLQTTHDCVALNPDVSQETLNRTVCVAGYTKSVRPSSAYTQGIKVKLLKESGIDSSRMGEFELDHIVPLALGGHPRRLSNLWLQPWDGPHGANRKDGLEVRLQRLVCAGAIQLVDAQECIAEDWEACQLRLAGLR